MLWLELQQGEISKSKQVIVVEFRGVDCKSTVRLDDNVDPETC